jgi:hypothetical protein
MARVVRREIRKRGFFGTIFKILFILFNLLMLAWIVLYWTQVSTVFDNIGSGAGRTGAQIGVTFASGFILFVWAAGDVILGLLTLLSRGSKVIVEESTY